MKGIYESKLLNWLYGYSYVKEPDVLEPDLSFTVDDAAKGLRITQETALKRLLPLLREGRIKRLGREGRFVLNRVCTRCGERLGMGDDAHFLHVFGFESMGFDGQFLDLYLCERCMDLVTEKVLALFEVNPMVDYLPMGEELALGETQ